MAANAHPIADHDRDESWLHEREVEIITATLATRRVTLWANLLCWLLICIACLLLPNFSEFVMPLILRLVSMIVTARLSGRLASRIAQGERYSRLMGAISLNLVLVGMSWSLLLFPILSEASRHPAHLVIGYATLIVTGSILTTLSALRAPYFAYAFGFFVPLLAFMMVRAHGGGEWGAVVAFASIFVVMVLYTKAGGQQRINAADSVVENRRLGARLAGLLERAEYNAVHDPLTGLYNRRALFEAHLVDPDDRRRKHVLLIDLDHFKKLNDVYGHDAGDQVLRAVADSFVGVLGELPGDEHFAVRLGGEEFAVVLFVSDPDRAHAVAERIRFAVALVAGRVGLVDHKTTASIGMTHFDCGERLDDVFARADRAMYRAKSSGRNQVRRHAA